jgi:putative NADH-flavin reductase
VKVALFGATGGVGGHLLRRCLEAGHAVRALVRDPAKLPPGLDAANLEIVAGDARDAAAVASTIAGTEAVFSALGGDDLKETTLYSVAGGHIVDAMEREGPRRLVVVTSGGVEREPNATFIQRTLVFGGILKNVLTDMRRMEERVEHSTLDWTIVRPTRLMDDPATGRYRVAERFMLKGAARINRADVAGFMLKAAADPAAIRKIYALAE